MADPLPVAGDVIGAVSMLVVEIGHRTDVGAGSKGFLIAGNDDDANSVVGLESGQCRSDRVDYGVIQSIELLGTVEADQTDTAVGFGQNERGSSFTDWIFLLAVGFWVG